MPFGRFDFGRTSASGATLMLWGRFFFGTAPLSADQETKVPAVKWPCTIGCLLDADAGREWRVAT
jgi:hypothetical protein